MYSLHMAVQGIAAPVDMKQSGQARHVTRFNMQKGQVTEVLLTCYLVLLSIDSKTRLQESQFRDLAQIFFSE